MRRGWTAGSCPILRWPWSIAPTDGAVAAGAGIRAAKLIVRFAGIRLLSFIGVLRDGFGRYGDRFVSTVVVGCGLLMARWSGRNQPSRMRAVFMMSPSGELADDRLDAAWPVGA